MTKNGGVFTCDIALTANQDFKFLVSTSSWWPGVVNASSDPHVYQPVLYPTEPAATLDKKFQVDRNGIYRLTVNTTDVNNITMTAELLSEDTSPAVETIYIAGYAISKDVAYALSGIPESHFLQPVEGQSDTYTWTGVISAGEGLQFKFLTSHYDWVPSYNRDAASPDYWKLTYRTSYAEPDEQFQVDVTGTYEITLNTKALTISCVLQ